MSEKDFSAHPRADRTEPSKVEAGERTRLVLHQAPMRPELEALLERARNHVMTPAERIAQRRSWVKGEFMIEHPEMAESDVDALLDRTLPELGSGRTLADATPNKDLP